MSETTSVDTSVNSALDDHFASMGLVAVSEADLGKEAEPEEPSEIEDTDDSEPLEDEDKAEETEVPEEETTEEPEEEKAAEEEPEGDSTKPPKGYVPLQALHEARTRVTGLQAEVTQLKAKLYEATKPKKVEPPLVTETEVSKFKDFKVLSKAEAAALMEDNATAGLEYVEKLSDYMDYSSRLAKQQVLDASAKAKEAQEEAEIAKVVDDVCAECERLIPGIFADDRAVANDWAEFAESKGFSEELFPLLSPTTIVSPVGKEPFRIGKNVVGLLKMIMELRKAPSKDDLKKQIRTELTTELKAELGNKAVADIKSKKAAKPQMQDIPDAAKSTPKLVVLSDKAYEKLSEQDKQRYLMGTLYGG
jgi:hypothetical protein